MSNEPPERGQENGPAPEPPVFRHPQWMVGVVLVFAVAAIVAGVNDPVWCIIGTPCIIVLCVYVWVRLKGPVEP